MIRRVSPPSICAPTLRGERRCYVVPRRGAVTSLSVVPFARKSPTVDCPVSGTVPREALPLPGGRFRESPPDDTPLRFEAAGCRAAGHKETNGFRIIAFSGGILSWLAYSRSGSLFGLTYGGIGVPVRVSVPVRLLRGRAYQRHTVVAAEVAEDFARIP